MMTFYSQTSQKSTRNTFAREAALDTFGRQGRWALDEPDFQDRLPGQRPRRIGKVVDDVGRRALRHWLTQAAEAADDNDHAAAMEVAAELARVMGLELPGLSKRRAA